MEDYKQKTWKSETKGPSLSFATDSLYSHEQVATPQFPLLQNREQQASYSSQSSYHRLDIYLEAIPSFRVLFYPKTSQCLCSEKLTLREPEHAQVKTVPNTSQAKGQLEHASVTTTAMKISACGRVETLFDMEGQKSCVNELINSKKSLGLTMQGPMSCKSSLNNGGSLGFSLILLFSHTA